jgi:di/tricarboxylate transporter
VFIALRGDARSRAPREGGLGFVVIQQFVISFGFLLPVSAPQNMLGYGTGAFTAKQFLKTGIPLTVLGYLLVRGVVGHVLEVGGAGLTARRRCPPAARMHRVGP